jgi:DNA-binding transcriptional regulator YhcF (GntR family)
MLIIDEAKVEGSSRPIGLRFCLMTLRLLEQWRAHLGIDLDSALIVMATAAITMEKYTRSEFEPAQRDIRTAMASSQLTKCNVRSIAAATGLNRETARRKVKALVDAGILLNEDGAFRLSAEYTRSVQTSDMLRRLLETLVQSANELQRVGVLRTRGRA